MTEKIISGISSSLIASVICYPLETICIQKQVRSYNSKLLTSRYPLDYYRGFSVSATSRSIFYGVFFPTEKLISEKINSPLISSYFAACTASTCANPFYVIKTRRQTEILSREANNSRIFKPSCLFRGLGITYIKNTEMGIMFPLFKYLQKILSPSGSDGSDILSNVVASFISKTMASFVFYPVDIIRTIFRNNTGVNNITRSLINIYKNDGYKGFYRGYTMYFAKSVPATVIVFCMNEYLLNNNTIAS